MLLKIFLLYGRLLSRIDSSVSRKGNVPLKASILEGGGSRSETEGVLDYLEEVVNLKSKQINLRQMSPPRTLHLLQIIKTMEHLILVMGLAQDELMEALVTVVEKIVIKPIFP